MKNKIIVFEGPDGSGKTTQCLLLQKYLANKNRNVKYLKARVKTKAVYEMICEIEEKNNLLFMERFPKWLKSCLIAYERSKQLYDVFCKSEDSIILVDKYIYSTSIYLEHIGINARYPDMLLRWLPKPDLVFFFDTDAEVCMDRIIRRGEKIGKNENLAFLEKLNEQMKQVICSQIDNVCIINGNEKDIEKVFANIKERTMNLLDNRGEWYES